MQQMEQLSPSFPMKFYSFSRTIVRCFVWAVFFRTSTSYLRTRHAPLWDLACRYAFAPWRLRCTATLPIVWHYGATLVLRNSTIITQKFCRWRLIWSSDFCLSETQLIFDFFPWGPQGALKLFMTNALLTKFGSVALALKASTLALRYCRNRAALRYATLGWRYGDATLS